jgi:hypothetical protein
MRISARVSIGLGFMLALAGATQLGAQDSAKVVRRINGVDAQARDGIEHGSGVLFVSSITLRAKSPN